jgi:nucleotide-binding universal stress UspA family protein
MITNVLVCLDGTELGEAILPLAADIAERFSSKIVLLNVIFKPFHVRGIEKAEIVVKQSAWIPENEEKVDNYLEQFAEILRKRSLDVECVTIEGTIEESIITYARTYKIGLIALATHDRSSLSRMFLGSTTDFVIRKSGIPVLVLCPDNSPVSYAGKKQTDTKSLGL